MTFVLQHLRHGQGKKVQAMWGNYPNGRIALQLVDAVNGERVATATVNVVTADLKPNEVCIKDYAENEGMAKAMVAAGLVHAPHRYVPSGHVTIPVCKLTTKGEVEYAARRVK